MKGDTFWGIGFGGEGGNVLAVLLMELRDELVAEEAAGRGVGADGAYLASELEPAPARAAS